MPLYDYRCPKCDSVKADVLERWDAKPQTCFCGRSSRFVTMVRQPSAPAAVSVIGYSAKNGYHMPSESQPANLKGIRTTVKEG